MAENDLDKLLDGPEDEELDSRELQRRNQLLEKQLQKHRSGAAIIADTVRQIFETPVKLAIPPMPERSKKRRTETAVLQITDPQLGKLTRTYNIVVARRRLRELVRRVRETVTDRRAGAAIDDLRIYACGDLEERCIWICCCCVGCFPRRTGA